MDELISRQAAIEAVVNGLSIKPSKTIVRKMIEAIPASDPERHGEWIGTQWDGYADGNPVYDEWECSVCGYVFAGDEAIWRYCPNCGAKMDGWKK